MVLQVINKLMNDIEVPTHRFKMKHTVFIILLDFRT